MSEAVVAQTTSSTSTGSTNTTGTTSNTSTGTGSSHPDMQETTVTKTITTYYKWNAETKVWIITKIAAEAGRTEVTSYSYKCCLSGGNGCNYNPCDL